MKTFTKLFCSAIVLLASLAFAAKAQTNVSGGIYANTTWTLANSPYIVVDTVIVYPGDTLTIEPGVVVKFADHKRLELRSAFLIAEGTITDSITFTSNSATPDSGSWDEIYLNPTIDSIQANFNYCNISFSTNGIYSDFHNSNIVTVILKNSFFFKNNTALYNNTLHNDNAMNIDSCNFLANTTGMIYTAPLINYSNISHNQVGFSNCYITAKNCLINSNQIGVRNDEYSGVHVMNNCIIRSNQTGFVYGDVLIMTNCVIDSNQIGLNQVSYLTIDSSSIRQNQIGIIDTSSLYGKTSIQNSSIDTNSVMGIYLSNRGYSVINCEINGNGIGMIMNVGGTGNTIAKNIVESNVVGVELGDSVDSIYCNKFCNNTSFDLKYTGTSNVNISNNYWCTTDSVSTQVVIFDGNDSTGLGFVNFMPLTTDLNRCYHCFSIYVAFSQAKCAYDSLTNDGFATAYIPNGFQPYTYTWNTSPIQTTQTATGLSVGLYTVCITDSMLCPTCSSVFICDSSHQTINVNELSDDKSFSIFPNPASNYLTVVLPTNIEKTEIKIFNLFGQLKYSSIIAVQKRNIDISNLTSGIYIIQLETDSKIGRQKFIKG